MSDRARIQVDELGPEGMRTTVVYFDRSTPAWLAERLRPVLEEALARMPFADPDAAMLLAAEVAKLKSDEEAYDRECARRGVLAL